ncbi:hypothetical protein VTO42DRAFT_7450 [Malbranchea cinnamomea]
MSSYFQNQINSFSNSVIAAASRLPQERRSAAPSSRPVTTTPQPPSTSVPLINGSRHDGDFAYSQPANTGMGKNIMTQVYYAIENMKRKDTWLTFSEICRHLSLQREGHQPEYIEALRRILQSHEKVEYDPSGADGEGTFRFKPPHDIRTAEQLLAKLQSQPTAQGMSVKELREGWANCNETINRLEKEGKLLVTRNKKDDHPKMIWANDPSLMHHFDPEFRQIWERIKIPDSKTVAEELEKAGITPTSKYKDIKARPKVEQKKVKKPRRSGKTTNVHMAGVLRDYSHLKR